MTIKPELRQRVLKYIVLFRKWGQKKVAALVGRKSVYYLLSKEDRAPIDERTFEKTLAALQARPAHAEVIAACLESMEFLEQPDGPSIEERDAVELALVRESQQRRALYLEIVRRLRELPPLDGYPEPAHREPLRWFARLQLQALKELKTEEERLAVVQECREYQHWALMEIVADESEEAASRSVEESTFWSSLAVEIAERVRGPEGWLRSVCGYAAACTPNSLRVAGELELADAALEGAKSLWLTGSDPDQVLDPGRLLDLEGSLRRAQRRFDESLDRLQEAGHISHRQARVLIKRAFTLEVMGEYEQAIDTLLQAEPLVDRQVDAQLWYKLNGNLAVCYTHVARYDEAAELEELVRAEAFRLGDHNEVVRCEWVRGRIAAGLGKTSKARALLESALEGFRARKLWYDVALAFVELAALLLREGRRAEVRALTPILADVFKSKKVYVEALKALRCFVDAAESDAADEELARRILNFLFRARHDQGLRFES